MPKGQMRALTEDGDLKVIWDTEIDDEVKAAEDQFNNLIKKGYKAFLINKEGNKGKEIKRFNPDAGMIILTPALVGG